jgi:hypothetical protein
MPRYPFELLADLGRRLEPAINTKKRRLSPVEVDTRATIQAAYVWIQNYSESEKVPHTSTPSYAELWYMLKYCMQIQMLLRSLPASFDHIKEAHKSRFDAEMAAYPMLNGGYTYTDVLHIDLSSHAAIVCNCANFQKGLEPCDE